MAPVASARGVVVVVEALSGTAATVEVALAAVMSVELVKVEARLVELVTARNELNTVWIVEESVGVERALSKEGTYCPIGQ